MLTRNRLLFLFFIGSVFLLQRCEFHPDEVPENKISPPDESAPPIFMSLNDHHDTLKIGWETDFSYNITGANNKIISVVITFQDNELHHYVDDGNQTFSFSFDPRTYSNGNYNLNIKIITSSGSGSIADKVGSEGYFYELSWPVLIDNTLPDRPYCSSVTATKTSGGVELRWPAFNHINFVSYIIYRQYPFFQENAVPIGRIVNPLDTVFTDTTYWEGQNAIYYIRFESPGLPFDGDYTGYYDQLTGLKATWSTDGTAYVTWDKAKNLESFGKYYVYAGWRFDNFIEEYYIEDPEQNYVILKNVGFGTGLYIFLKFLPRGISENEYNLVEYKMIELIPPPTIPDFRFAYNANNKEFMLLADNQHIYRYFPYEARTEDMISVNIDTYWLISISSNGDKFVYYQDNKFYIKRTSDFYSENEFTGPPLRLLGRAIQSYSLSDNGRLLATDNEGFVYFYDTQNGQLLREDSLDVRGDPVKFVSISPDGTSMVVQIGSNIVALFTVDQSGWKEIGRTEIVPFRFFYSKDGSSIYIAGYDKMENRRADNFELISEYSLPAGYFRSVDIDRGRFYWDYIYSENSAVVDLNTGKTLITIPWNWGATPFDNYLVVPGLQLTLPKFE
jgi:hypothetical protein